MDVTGISVIVPTYNTSSLLDKTLNSLKHQNLDKSLFEVLVIDDGSTDNTREVTEQYKQDFNVRYFYQEDLGFRAAAARNVGIREAAFSHIVILDSGIMLAANTLARHIAIHSKKDKQVLIGLSHGVEEHTDVTAKKLREILDSNSLVSSFDVLKNEPDLHDCREEYLNSIGYKLELMQDPWLIFWTSHVSCSKAMLLEIGGFDEWFNSWGAEDVEVGLRLYQHGGEYRLLDDVLSIHYPHETDSEKKVKNSRKNCVYMHQKHNLEATRLLCQYNWLEIITMFDQQKQLSDKKELVI